MFVVAVANTKGGCGKTTLATHLAASFACRGYATGLADLDRQKSALGWLKRRPEGAAPIQGINLAREEDIPEGIERLVVDAAAAMDKDVVKDIVRRADLVVVPVLPGVFDEDGTARFVGHLESLKSIRKNRRDVAFVANRVRLNTRALTRLGGFLEELSFPVIARLRDTQHYTAAAAEGLSLFDLPGGRAADYRAEWTPLLDFIEIRVRG
ncbi:ParA family protein [Rhodospirillum rubrum]|uniref:Partition-related protein n=1 Tax=Rhodospirillum rubrum (strain ATCC 11170 / ATH 1.1.1 / DSM 467 / LMG 4362 / NCIMB 8255 / S1) TaxID=269796 RepID=Q2RPL4_RHORT|nr:ParA family protein [Rhodospirillum rubrum]ABC23931.1 putative partition-related protein [Rhodospirillum rubrum ATCC 11170]AEO49675.1 putative partition-like protein [Rhodospirillum rubrum F11]MBK5955629.1 chromosome partitioning protein ParA [Rhodospirillum rubrum]QXG79875.1 ParA family protein [Rhodospirillum rubrum]HCF16471.1 chromosome partitioning protein ParA [Rhodospirillum rubrum]